MKKSFFTSLCVVIVLTIWMMSGRLTATSSSQADSGPTTQADNDEKLVDTMKVQVEDRLAESVQRKIIVLGQSEPMREIRIVAEVSGRVESLGVKIGERVRTGQQLAQLAINDRKALVLEAKAGLEKQQADFEAAKRLQKRGLQSQTGLSTVVAQLESARARLEQAQINLDKTSINAPFPGVVNEKFIDQGSFADRGDPVFILIDDRRLLITGQVPQQSISDIKTGQTAIARFMDGQEVKGMVSFVSARGDNSTRSFRIEVEIPNEQARLLSGVSTEIHLPIEELPGHLLSPAMLSLDDKGRLGVKTVDDENIVRFYPISIVRTETSGAWVSGLPKKVRIITLGQGFVQAGERVEPVEKRTTSESDILDDRT